MKKFFKEKQFKSVLFTCISVDVVFYSLSIV